MAMTLERPDRVYVQVRNARTGKSKTATFYGCDEKTAMQEIIRAWKAREASKRRQPATVQG